MNFRKLAIAVGLASTVSMTAAGVQAATYGAGDFNPAAGPFSFSCDAGGFLNNSCSVSFSGSGVGVAGTPDTQSNQIDGSQVNSWESLTVTFNQAVTLVSFRLGKFDRNDDYELALNGGAFGASITDNPNFVNAVVNSFTIRASSSGLGENVFKHDDFTLASFEIAPVPLPGAGVMLVGALGGLAAVRRRRKAA